MGVAAEQGKGNLDIRPSGDRGLRKLTSVLEECGVEYWIDSGVLLGLVRNGRLNSWEKDIDLAVTDDQLEALLSAVPALEGIGYRVSVNRYHGLVFSVGLKPRELGRCTDLRASVHVYYIVSEYLWSPQAQLYVPPPAPDVYRARRTLAGNILKRALERLFYSRPDVTAERSTREPDRRNALYALARWIYRKVDCGVLAETWPVREVYVPMSWVIPRALVMPLQHKTIQGDDYVLPARVDEYLSLRYGDWRVPVTDWCYWEDDGAIVRGAPFEVRERLLSGGRARERE